MFGVAQKLATMMIFLIAFIVEEIKIIQTNSRKILPDNGKIFPIVERFNEKGLIQSLSDVSAKSEDEFHEELSICAVAKKTT